MKKSFVVFSLIGLVAIGMCFNSCSKETKPTYSYEEGWEMFNAEVAKLNQTYNQLLLDSIRIADTNVETDFDLRCTYKGANSGKLMYKVLERVFSEEFLAKSEGMSQDELKKSVMEETEKLTGGLDEQLKAQILNLTVSEMRDYTEAYIKLINTLLTDKEEKMILTMQCSMQYYIFAFWNTEGAKLL